MFPGFRPNPYGDNPIQGPPQGPPRGPLSPSFMPPPGMPMGADRPPTPVQGPPPAQNPQMNLANMLANSRMMQNMPDTTGMQGQPNAALSPTNPVLRALIASGRMR